MEEYANEFQLFCSCITKFLISTNGKVERFLVGLKEEIGNKVPVDPKGYGDPWEDIKSVIHYVVTIDAT